MEFINIRCFHVMTRNIALIFISLMFLAMFLGCSKEGFKAQDDLKKEDFRTEYQGVLLVGGMAYFGKIEKIGPHYIEMTDVYYIQNSQNPETKEVQSILVKRGKEWHGPDRMYINCNHVLMIEPVSQDSKLAQSIKELKSK